MYDDCLSCVSVRRPWNKRASEEDFNSGCFQVNTVETTSNKAVMNTSTIGKVTPSSHHV